MNIITKTGSGRKESQIYPQLKKLIFSKDLYSFLGVLDTITSANTPTDEIIRQSAKIFSMSLYRDSYEEGVPQSMMGFCAASQMKKYLPVEDQIQPLTQMLWLSAVEEKRTPYNLQSITVSTGGNVITRLRKYQDALREKDLKRAYGLFEGFFRNERERQMLCDFVFGETIKDSNLGGQKYMYFVKGWQLAKLLKWTDVRLMFFPMNHLLATVPKDPAQWEIVRAMISGRDTAEWIENVEPLSAKEHDVFEEMVLCGKQDAVIRHIAALLDSGKSPKSVLDGILVSASQLVADADASMWEAPVNAFNYTDSAHYFVHMSKDSQTVYAPFMAALAVNKVARKFEPAKQDKFSAKPYSSGEDPLKVFKNAVIHFDTENAVAAVKAILPSKNKMPELYRTVLLTASMNDAVVCRGRDMQYCYHTLNAYEMTSSPRKDKLMLAMARFLGYINKNYVLYREVWG
jgi:hypothetical protein